MAGNEETPCADKVIDPKASDTRVKNRQKSAFGSATFNGSDRSIRVRTLAGLVRWLELPRDSRAAKCFQGSNSGGKPRLLKPAVSRLSICLRNCGQVSITQSRKTPLA